MFCDYHTHTIFSDDSEYPMEECVKDAIYHYLVVKFNFTSLVFILIDFNFCNDIIKIRKLIKRGTFYVLRLPHSYNI